MSREYVEHSKRRSSYHSNRNEGSAAETAKLVLACLLCIICFPIGLIVLWTRRQGPGTKLLLTVITGVLFFAFFSFALTIDTGIAGITRVQDKCIEWVTTAQIRFNEELSVGERIMELLPKAAEKYANELVSRYVITETPTSVEPVITLEPTAAALPGEAIENSDTAEATEAPSVTAVPTEEPAPETTAVPTEEPAVEATAAPTEEPAPAATAAPTEEPAAVIEETPAPESTPAAAETPAPAPEATEAPDPAETPSPDPQQTVYHQKGSNYFHLDPDCPDAASAMPTTRSIAAYRGATICPLCGKE